MLVDTSVWIDHFHRPHAALVAALERGVALSDPCYAAVDGETVLVLFGVYPQPGAADVGIVWLLGSDDITTYSRLFLRLCRPWLEKLQGQYRILRNWIDARNEVHIRWLKWSGFTFLRRIERFGVEGRPFYEFMRAPVPAQPS